jgi:hypothetical protein
MSINYAAILKDFATWYSLAAAFLGAAGHKIWSKLVGAEKELVAKIKKLEAGAAAQKI